MRAYRLYADQDLPPPDDTGRVRDVKIHRGDDGTGQIIVTLGDLEVEEFAATLQAFIDLRYRPVDRSSCATRRLQPCGDERAPPVSCHSS